MRNTDVKIQIMRQKKNLTKDVKFHDDITQRNLGLMARLKNTEKFGSITAMCMRNQKVKVESDTIFLTILMRN